MPIPSVVNYYEILGVPTNATAEQIKIAYREIMKRYHSNKHGYQQDSLARLATRAYDVLSDREMREQYDNSLRSGKPTPVTSSPAQPARSNPAPPKSPPPTTSAKAPASSSPRAHSVVSRTLTTCGRCYGDGTIGGIFSRQECQPGRELENKT